MDHEKRKEAAEIIRAFATGTGGPYDWDDFISPKREEPEEKEVVDYCSSARLLYPLEKGAWCSEEGLVKMLGLADLLESSVSSDAISDFIQAEYKRLGAQAPQVASPPPRRRLDWYWSRVFWFGLLGFAFLIWLWGYKLEVPTTYLWQRSGGDSLIGVGDSRIWLGSRVQGDSSDPFGQKEEGFHVIEEPPFTVFTNWFAVETKGELAVSHGYGYFSVMAGHGLVVAGYGFLWLVTLVIWQQRKHRLNGSVRAGKAGWIRIVVPLVVMLVMAVAMTKRDRKLPKTWNFAFRSSAREVWNQLNEDGVVTAQEIIERCYQQGSHDDGDRMIATAWALVGQGDDPIPALQKMMGEELPERRAFAALTAGYLGDVRLRGNIGELQEDKAELPYWFWDTVGDAAEDAFKALDRGGIVKSVPKLKEGEGFTRWLKRAEAKE